MLELRNLLKQWISGSIEPPPIASLVGFKLLEAADGRSRVELSAGRVHHNPMGTVHGGVFCDLADAAMGTALASLADPGEVFSTTNLSIQYFSPIIESTLFASGQVTRLGKTVAHLECEIVDGDGKLVAKAWSTCQISSAQHPRQGWEAQFANMAKHGDDRLLDERTQC